MTSEQQTYILHRMFHSSTQVKLEIQYICAPHVLRKIKIHTDYNNRTDTVHYKSEQSK